MISKNLPAYLYQQYQYDDTTEDLQAFFTAYNNTSQENLDRLNNLNLPNYTTKTGNMLDWVAEGIYGFTRPVLPRGAVITKGLYNNNLLDTLAYDEAKKTSPSSFYETTDDIFKRCITWNFYKGDGFQFDIQWLKRRVARFLAGTNGTDPQLGETYQVSVTFDSEFVVTINILPGVNIQGGGSLLNTFDFNEVPFDAPTVYASLIPTDLAPILESAINAGVLQLPFGYTFNVTY